MEKKEAADYEALQLQVLDFVTSTSETISALETEKRALEQKLSALATEKVRLEKVASTKPSFTFSKDKIDGAVNSLINLSLLDEKSASEVAASLASDPEAVFPMFEVLVDRFYKVASRQTDGVLEENNMVDAVRGYEDDADAHWKKLANSR